MNITKEKVAKLLDFVEAYAGVSPEHECATILRGLEDAEPIGEFVAVDDGLGTVFIELYDQKSRVAGVKIYTHPPQADQTEAALREVVRLSEDAGLYDEPKTEAQEREAFEAEFDQLCKDYSIYGLIEARLCKVFFEAGRAGRKV